jgi:hypothetical protein
MDHGSSGVISINFNASSSIELRVEDHVHKNAGPFKSEYII